MCKKSYENSINKNLANIPYFIVMLRYKIWHNNVGKFKDSIYSLEKMVRIYSQPEIQSHIYRVKANHPYFAIGTQVKMSLVRYDCSFPNE